MVSLKLTHLSSSFTLLLPLLLLSLYGLIALSLIDPRLAKQQILFLLLAVLAYLLTSRLDYQILPRFSLPIYAALLIFIILPGALGSLVRGTERWITIGSLTIQPAVISLPWLIVIIASWFSQHPDNSLKHLLWSIIILLVPSYLIFSQPDLGTTLVLISSFIGIIISLGIKFRKLFIIFLLTIPLALLAPILLKPYQIQRITSFFNPTSDPLGSGYHVIQSTIAVGSGRLLGRGLGQGIQSQLRFLPASHTDFVFASISEQFGFSGAFVLLSLYFVLFLLILKTIPSISHPLGKTIIVGIFTSLLFQTVTNIGMNIGLVPVTGIPLPAVSYGGSSLIAIFSSLGLIDSVASHSKTRSTLRLR